MVKAVKEAIKELDVCAGGIEEIKNIIKKLEDIDLEKIWNRIVKDATHIFADILEAKTAFLKGDLPKFGKAVGDILFRIFLKEEATE